MTWRPLKPGESLPALTLEQERLAEHIASLAAEQLRSCDPSLVACCCAHMLARVLTEHAAVEDLEAVEPLTVALVGDVLQRINSLVCMQLALMRAMNAGVVAVPMMHVAGMIAPISAMARRPPSRGQGSAPTGGGPTWRENIE